jgi:hypothetical protein
MIHQKVSPYAESMRKYATLRLIYSNAEISYPQTKTKNIDINIPGSSQWLRAFSGPVLVD